MAHLDIAVLGPFTVTLAGRPLTGFRTDNMRALLAYLAVEQARVHRRAMLAGLLWPEVPEATARHNLSQALLLLRQLLDDAGAVKDRPERAAPPFLLATRHTLRFNPASDHTLDVAQFEAGLAASAAPDAMAQAVTYYRGEFLSDLWQNMTQAFEEWALFRRTHYHLLALDALETLADDALARGAFAQAADYARRHIALEPLREIAHRQLMTALTQANRLPEALAHYADCTALLARELGIAPASETTAIYERIRATREKATLPPPVRREKPGTGPLGPPTPVFVGRQRELTRLDQALTLAANGQGQVHFITGDAGSGKTALLRAFAHQALAAHPDVLVVNGSGNAYIGTGDPYWPFIEILEQLYPPGGNAASIGALPLGGAQAERLSAARPVIAPVLRQCAPDLVHLMETAGLGPGQTDLQQASLFAQVTRALHALAAAQPIVVLLDDLQWADQDSINLLFHLGQHLGDHPLLIVGALRPDVLYRGYTPGMYLQTQPGDQRHPLAVLMQELQRRWGDIQLDLARASGRAFIDALVDAELNHLDAAFRATLYQHTAGHALFTTELLRELQARGDVARDAQGFWIAGAEIAWDTLPGRVEGVIAERIGQLLPDWQAILTVASVEGETFTAEVAARVLDMDTAEVQRRLSGALSRHHYLVSPVGVQTVGETSSPQSLTRYRFRHLMFQSYLYQQLDVVERAQLHLQVGQTVETLYGERAPEISLRLARHFELGGDGAKAVAYLLQAGQRATRIAATEEALRLLTHGLTLLQQRAKSPARDQQEMALHLAMGNALLAQGWDTDERAQASARAYALGQHAGDIGQIARSLVMMADGPLGRGQLPQLTAIGEQLQALAQHPRVAASAPLAAQLTLYVDYVWGSLHFCRGDLLEARRHLTRESSTPDTPPDTLVETNLRVIGQTFLIYVLWLLGYPDQALACSQRVLATTRDLEYTLLLQFALSIGAVGVRYLRREPHAMQAALQQLAALDAATNAVILQPWIMLFTGWLRAVNQHDARGLDLMHQAIQSLEEANSQRGILLQYNLLMDGYLSLGQADAALAGMDVLLEKINATELRNAESEFLRLKGEALRALGQTAEAEACFQRALTVARKQNAKAWELRAAMSLCRLYQATGQTAKVAAARTQLAEVYAWFTEGFDTADLQDAAALLTEA